MKIIKNKSKIKIILPAITIVLLGAGYVVFAKFNDFWPFANQANNEVVKTETTTESLPEERLTENAENTPTDDTYDPEKTPTQYEGQTDNSEIHGDYNNEQFRIPEDEL